MYIHTYMYVCMCVCIYVWRGAHSGYARVLRVPTFSGGGGLAIINRGNEKNIDKAPKKFLIDSTRENVTSNESLEKVNFFGACPLFSGFEPRVAYDIALVLVVSIKSKML